MSRWRFMLLVLAIVALYVLVPTVLHHIEARKAERNLKSVLSHNADYITKINAWAKEYGDPLFVRSYWLSLDTSADYLYYNRDLNCWGIVTRIFASREHSEKAKALMNSGDYSGLTLEFHLFESRPPSVFVRMTKRYLYDCFHILPNQGGTLLTMQTYVPKLRGKTLPEKYKDDQLRLDSNETKRFLDNGPQEILVLEKPDWFAVRIFGASVPDDDGYSLAWLKQGQYCWPEWGDLPPDTQARYKEFLMSTRPKDIESLRVLSKKGRLWIGEFGHWWVCEE